MNEEGSPWSIGGCPDLDDLYMDDDADDFATSSIATNTAAASAGDPGVSLPVINSPFPAPGPAAGASENTESESEKSGPPDADESGPDSNDTGSR